MKINVIKENSYASVSLYNRKICKENGSQF